MISGDSVFTLWFVTMICLFYLLFPVLIYNYSVKRVIVVSAVLFVLLLLGHNFFEIFDKRLFVYLPLFTFGLLVAKQDAIHALLKKKVLLASLILAGGGSDVFGLSGKQSELVNSAFLYDQQFACVVMVWEAMRHFGASKLVWNACLRFVYYVSVAPHNLPCIA